MLAGANPAAGLFRPCCARGNPSCALFRGPLLVTVAGVRANRPMRCTIAALQHRATKNPPLRVGLSADVFWVPAAELRHNNTAVTQAR